MATIVRGPRAADHFTIISNHALRDERLSWKARGLLAYLMSMDTGWVTSVERLSNVAPDGRDSVKSALVELEKSGYLLRRQARTETGKGGTFANTEYHVTDDGTVGGFPAHGEPGTGDASVGGSSVGGSSADGQPETKKTSPKKTSPKKTSKTRGESSAVVEPSVTRAPMSATTPTAKLDAAGIAARDRGRFREWLRTVKGARNANAVIVKADPADLADQVREWRESLDIKAEPDAEPILCDHGHDIALGAHMCPTCDPARQRTNNHTPEPVTARPEWLTDLLATGQHDELAALLNTDGANA